MIPFALVDAFTDQPFAGNTAGVVITADGLSTEQMQRIARELGQTETCFVSATGEPDSDLALRWFTPTVEVDLCGHATVAAFVCLDAAGRIVWHGDRARLRCASRAGTVGVWLKRTAAGSPQVMLSAGVAPIMPAKDDRAAAAAAVGLDPAVLDPSLPLAADPGS